MRNIEPLKNIIAAVINQNGVHCSRCQALSTKTPANKGTKKPAVLPMELANANIVPAYSNQKKRKMKEKEKGLLD